MTDALVSTAWVAEQLGKPGVRIIDVSSEPQLYAGWHLPGAVAIDWMRELIEEEDESSGKIPDPERFAAMCRRLGLQPDDTLVFYGDKGGRHAGALHLMDGGREQWQREGAVLSLSKDRPTATGPVSVEPSGYPVPSGRRLELRATIDQITRSMSNADYTVLDVRTQGEYDGTDVRAARGGHIPGAVHIFWEDALTPDTTLRPRDELAQLFAAVPRDNTVAVHCQLGVRAAHTWFVLRHVLGYARAQNYDGSWQEWGNREDTPIES
jgi:thiosulfate/3-mercaptopyruvate sulfurtransferase